MEECGCKIPGEFDNYNQKDYENSHIIISTSESFENSDEEDNISTKNEFSEIYQNKNNKNHQKEKTTEEQLIIKKEISLQESTGPNTKKKELNQSQHKISLQKKINKKEKGFRRDIMMKRIMVNLCKDTNKLVYKLMKTPKKFIGIYLKEINKNIYLKPKALDNIIFLEKKLKYVISEINEKNNNIIHSIMLENDYLPLTEVLEKTMNELHDIHCGNVIVQEDYYKEFIQGYENFFSKVKKKKNPEYCETFTKYSKNLLNEFKNINEHAKNKKKKNN